MFKVIKFLLFYIFFIESTTSENDSNISGCKHSIFESFFIRVNMSVSSESPLLK